MSPFITNGTRGEGRGMDMNPRCDARRGFTSSQRGKKGEKEDNTGESDLITDNGARTNAGERG